jgi:hypothetical protein
MKQLYFLLLLCLTATAIGQSNYVAEDFDYPDGNALTEHGWFAHSAAETNPILVSVPGLNWAGYIGSAAGNSALVNNTGQDVNKPFPANISSGKAYSSFLIRINSASTTGFFFHYGYYTNNETPNAEFSNLATAFRARTFVTQGTNAETQFKLGLSFNTTSALGETVDLNIGETYLVVVKYEFIDGPDNDEVSLYVFAEGDNIASEPATPVLGPFTGSAADAPALQAVALRQYSSGQDITVDGLYVRTVWDLTNPGTLSINDFTEKNKFILTPNPVNQGNVTIQTDLTGNKQIEVYDVNGRQVLKTTTTENSFNVDNFNAGLYLVKISVDNVSKVSKLIIN